MSSPNVFGIIQAFANNCYVPESDENIWSERILPAILANDNLAKVQATSYTWLQFTLQLVVLGYFDEKLISRVLSSSYLESYLKRTDLSILDLNKVLILYQTVSMRSDIDLSFVDSRIIDDICKMYTDRLPPCDIQEDLIDRLGKQCVLTNVRTKHMHIISTLVKINKKSGHFEPFSQNIVRNQDGFISLTDIPCDKHELL